MLFPIAFTDCTYYTQIIELPVYPLLFALAIAVTMAVSPVAQKWIVFVSVVAILAVIAIALYDNSHSTTVPCSQESQQCIDACFTHPAVLLEMDDPAHFLAENSTFTVCLNQCLDTDFCNEEETPALFQQIPTKNQIILRFRDANSSYDVFLDDQKVSSVTDRFYTIQNLTPETPYRVIVKKVDDGETEIAYLYTLSENQQDIDQEIATVTQVPANETSTEEWDKLFYSSFLAIHVSKQRIVLTVHGWVPHDDRILEIYRDGEFLGIMENHTFIDRTFQSGGKYDYSVRGNKNITPSEMEQRKRELKRRIVTFDNETFANETFANATIDDLLGDFHKDHYQLERNDVETVESIQLPDPMKATMQAASNRNGPYYLRYMTFIPWQYLENPLYTSKFGEPIKTKYFNGNDRGFRATVSIDEKLKYKTWSEVKVDFARKTVGSSVDVGITIGYDKNKKEIWRDTTKKSCMKLTSKDLSKSDRYTWSFSHSCGNPWPGWFFNAISPDIDYFYQATVYKNGDWQFKGRHDECPSHEIYIAREGNKERSLGWQTIYRWRSSTNFVGKPPLGFNGGLAAYTARVKVAGKTPK
jgi:hypothetical protein